MPRGSNAKPEREYEELEYNFEKSGRYKERRKKSPRELSTSNVQSTGKAKPIKKQEKQGTNPDRNLPIDHYRHRRFHKSGRKQKTYPPNKSREWNRTRRSTRTGKERWRHSRKTRSRKKLLDAE